MSENQDSIRKHFGQHADYYATSFVHAQGASLARLVDLTRPRADWLALDVSTGAGHTALTFAKHVARVIATDLTPEMLAAAERLAHERGIVNIEFKPADAQALPFQDNTFDLVTNRLAVHHYPDARQGIAEMVRVCKPGGLVALVDNVVPPDKQTAGYINHFEKLRDPSHNWAYPVVRLESYFKEVGLAIQASETLVKDMEFKSWAERMGISPDRETQLRKLLSDAPEAVKGFLNPHSVDDKLFFALHEVVLVGRKG